MTQLQIWIPGIPKPGGSKRGFYVAKLKRVIITDACKESADWKRSCAFFARAAYEGQPLDRPLAVWFDFFFMRPKGHFKPNGALRNGAPQFPTVRPDATKCTRSTEDGCTGILWRDDSLIVQQHVTKNYSEQPGCRITVKVLSDNEDPTSDATREPAATHPLFDDSPAITTFMEGNDLLDSPALTLR